MKVNKNVKNSGTSYVKILTEICHEEDIEITPFSYDWIFRLNKNGIIRYILGYQFDLNTSAVQSICNDKCATSDILSFNNISCVEHVFFMSQTKIKYLGVDGSWKRIIKMLEKYHKLVCKPNEGSSGTNVYIASNQTELEYAVDRIFRDSNSMAISPYYDIQNEYRVIVLEGKIRLIFSKQIQNVVGNGYSTLSELLFKYINDNQIESLSFELKDKNFQTILGEGEIYRFNWKHNLGQGAKPKLIEDEEITNCLTDLAIQAATALNIKFASIDIICTENSYKILEINSGVMMEHFSSFDEKNYCIAKKIYKDAINLMFS